MLVAPLLSGCVEPAHVEREWTALGQPASAEVWATTRRTAEALQDEFPAAMERVVDVMARERADSELNRLNREAQEGYYRVTDHDLFRAVALAVDYAKASEGIYDPTLAPVLDLYRRSAPVPPAAVEIEAALGRVAWDAVVLEREVFAVHFRKPAMQLTLDGMIEGYAIDVAARKFVRTGSLAGVLRLGPHVYAWGRPPGDEPFGVDVYDPRAEAGRPFARVRLDASRGIGLSCADSGSGLVLDPRDGRPASSDVLVAAAIADSVADAVTISRALLVGGSTRAGRLLGEKTRRVEAILLVRGEDGPQLVASASLQGRFEAAEELAAEAPSPPRFLLPPAGLKGRLD
jgi:thiamine biosynthesis lipoprotein